MLVSLPQSPPGLGWMELNRARRGKDTVRRQKFKTCASASAVGTVQCALAGSAPILSARFPLHSDFVYKNNFEKRSPFLVILLKWEEDRTVMWTTRHLLQACKNVSSLSLAQARPRVCSLWHPRVSEERRSCSSTTDVKAQDKILTVPNLLCVGRIFASPYLAFSIVEGELVKSFAIFCLAGFSDLVSSHLSSSFAKVE